MREKAGLNVNQLAVAAVASGITRQYIAEIEAGKKVQGWEIVCKLATALGVSTEEFRA